MLPCSAVLMTLAIGYGTLMSSLNASDGGSTTASSVVWPGTLGGNSSAAYGASTTGSVIVGYASNAAGNYRAFRWSPATGERDLGDLGCAFAVAYGVSGDGSAVVGEAGDGGSKQRA